MAEELDLIGTIRKQEKWSVFARLLETTKAIEWLNLDGDFTVFVPSDDAFAKIPDSKMNAFMQEPDQKTLHTILSYHIVSGLHPSGMLKGDRPLTALTGDEITFGDSYGLKANSAMVQKKNVQATNGIIHQIDSVLNPPPRKFVTSPLELAKTVSAAPTKKLEPITDILVSKKESSLL